MMQSRVLVLVAAACAVSAVAGGAPVYRNAAAPIPERVADLLSKMTLEEKAAQLRCPYGGTFDPLVAKFGKTGLGSARAGHNVAKRNEFQGQILNTSRLGIPVAFIQEALHSGTAGATIFPMPLTMGTSWNVELVQEMYTAVAQATRYGGANIAFAPVINLFTDPRFGRHQEGFSPNPTLTAHMATAAVLGLQGNGTAETYLDSKHVVSLGKHFAAYGAAAGGLNGGPANVGERTIRDVYLKPWRAFAKAGGRGAMPSHQTVLDVPCHANDWLVNTIFRGQLGFGNGLTISDCNDIPALMDFGIAADIVEATAKGLIGGLDQDLQCGNTFAYSYENINAALTRGLINETFVDRAVGHVLTMKFASGLFERPYEEAGPLDTHRALALTGAEEGIVLLKNEKAALPAASSSKFVIIGTLGGVSDTAKEALVGSYTQSGANVTTVIDAFTAGVPNAGYTEGASPDSAPDTTAINAAVDAMKMGQVAVVCVGDSLHTSGEWADRSLDLPGGQLELLEALVAAKPAGVKLVVVVINGKPATFGPLNSVLSGVDALLVTGRPGEMGGEAILNTIIGKSNPSGKLGANWPRTIAHIGSGSSPWLQSIVGKWSANTRGSVDPDGRRYDNYVDDQDKPTPLFYFGQGMSYTTFKYLKLQVVASSGNLDIVATATVTVENSGTVSGKEVVQVYVQDPVGGANFVVRPWKRLAGFAKVMLTPNAAQEVTIPILRDDIAFSQGREMDFGVYPGNYTFSAGGGSQDYALTQSLILSADK